SVSLGDFVRWKWFAAPYHHTGDATRNLYRNSSGGFGQPEPQLGPPSDRALIGNSTVSRSRGNPRVHIPPRKRWPTSGSQTGSGSVLISPEIARLVYNC